MPDTYDEQAAIFGEAAGLRPEQWPGLAHILRQTAAAEREACAAKAREYAAHHPQGSDGRNTFILLAEWIENRARGA